MFAILHVFKLKNSKLHAKHILITDIICKKSEFLNGRATWVRASLEIAGAKEQICACWVVKYSLFSDKFAHKKVDQEQFSVNFQ